MTSKQKFKSGDIVKLKSGGPNMTVDSYVASHIRCSWFAGNKLQMGSFEEDSLERVEEENIGKK
ncbi:DUF2158 domain-containing protein [Acidobacteria bacterium AH-259-A15]|nr:DUF2158 domain-containing protein [Acidobacteria bacterium AH-259-A15]